MGILVHIKKAKDLTLSERQIWMRVRNQNPALYSPYFHVAYTELIGELRPNTYVAVLTENGAPVGFFPFQGPKPGKSGFANPIGAPMTDYHGFIVPAHLEFSPREVLEMTGIGAFYYDSLIDPVGRFHEFHADRMPAAMIDLSKGADVWRSEQGGSYSRHLKSHRRRARKAEGQFGPRRATFKSTDRKVFQTLLDWKREQYAMTGKYDVLSVEWTEELIRHLWEHPGEIRADMHVLYFGNRIAAIDLGLTDGLTFHSWIVAYDNNLQSFGPGIQLLEALIDEAAYLGYARIDLGTGIEGYKRHYATENVSTASGFIPVKGPAAKLSEIYDATERLGKNALGDVPGKFRRRYTQIAMCDDSFCGRAKAMFEAVRDSKKSA